MYKIYINNAPLVLVEKGKQSISIGSGPLAIEGVYLGKSKFFFPYMDFLEKNGAHASVILHCQDVVKAFNDFATLFDIVSAGGGVVRNTSGQIAMIFRRGFWDLPKGKTDPEEHILQTAVREVKEEIGLHHIQAGEHLITTYHTYRTGKGKRILKVSTWFEMDTRDIALSPETGEDIELAEWVDPVVALDEKKPIFNNIREVIERYNDRFSKG
jgi:8-oxo-dGTP pyrophosphatase MutT (NUDIX family)